MSLNVGTSYLGSGGLRTGTISVDPVAAFVAAWTSRGMSGIILSDDLDAPMSAPGSIVSHLDGIAYTAQSAAGTPLLVPAGGDGPNGRAYMRANGINQTLIGGTVETVDTYCAVFRSPPGQAVWSGFGSIVDNSTDVSTRLGDFQLGSASYQNDGLPRSVRRNRLTTISPYNLSPITTWMVVTVGCKSNSAVTAMQLFALASTYFVALDLVAIGKWSTAPTSAQISGAESDASIYTGIALA